MAFTKVTSTLADTLNQNTTGSAATLTTARTIGGTSFDGSANIAVALSATTTALASARTIGGTSFDGTGNIAVATATEATNITAVANNSADETVYPTFVDGATGTQGLETDTGFTYNPSSGDLTTSGQLGGATLSLSGNATVGGNLTVTGTSTVVNTVTMNAQNAIVFEGATADNYETTLSIVDPTADHTQYLINQGGYIPVLAASTTVAISATPAELNLLDGSSANSVVNSKAVIYGSSGELAGTLSTAAQTAITSVGTLTSFRSTGIDDNADALAMTIDSSEKVGIGTTSPASYSSYANNLVVYEAGHGGITIATGTGNHASLHFADGTSGDTAYRGYLDYNHADDSLVIGAAGAERLRIASAGQLGIGGANYGTDGQVLTSTGTSSAPAWEAVPAGITNKTFGTSSIMIGDSTTGTISNANYNVGLGIDVFAALTSGDNNIAIGFEALNDVTTASSNTIVGHTAGDKITTGGSNVAIGADALGSNVDGTENTALGAFALASHTGANTVAVGLQALNANTSGEHNTAVGYNAMLLNADGDANTAVGKQSLDANTSGSYHVAIGYHALGANTTGTQNTIVGKSAGAANTTGGYNVAMGTDTFSSNTEGANNTAIGWQTMAGNTTGGENVAVGKGALDGGTTCEGNTAVGTDAMGGAVEGQGYNTAVGYNAMLVSTSASGTTAIGNQSLDALTTGDYNTAVGAAALGANSTTNNNTAVGYAALAANVAADNTAVGSLSLYTNNSGISNTAVGNSSLRLNTTASYNTAVGAGALYTNSTGAQNTAVGQGALNVSTASNNTAVGNNAGAATTSGANNVAIGAESLRGVCTGSHNVAIGTDTLKNITSGGENIAIGRDAMNDITDGTQNVAIGHESLTKMTSSGETVAVGFQALEVATSVGNTGVGSKAGELISGSGQFNTCIGYHAGDSITTGYRNTMLGQSTDVSAAGGAYQIAIGEDLIAYGQSTITVGSGASSNRVWNAFTSNASWTRISDERYKKDIQNNTDLGLAFINDLRPVTFKFKLMSEIDSSLPDYDETDSLGVPIPQDRMYGLIAQEVKEVLDDHNITDFGGHTTTENEVELQGISQEMFIHPLIKAVQELSAKVEALENN